LPGAAAGFAGAWTNWTSVRKVREGKTVNDLYAFLTTDPNAEAMPVILTTPVCTENLNPDVVVMESAEDRARLYASGPLNRANNRCVFVQ
jgi:putative SOS response-associated peptidase YedK